METGGEVRAQGVCWGYISDGNYYKQSICRGCIGVIPAGTFSTPNISNRQLPRGSGLGVELQEDRGLLAHNALPTYLQNPRTILNPKS